MSALPELSPEEKAKPYAKYYYREPAAPSPELAAALKDARPMDPAKALPIQRRNDLLDPGYFEVETGYCVMPDGSGYVSVLHPMPGVTPEMVRWWFAWLELEHLRYKLWFPRDHYGVFISDEDRAVLTDPAVPLERKVRNPAPKKIVRESIGAGSADIYIDFMAPEDQGFDMQRFHAPNVATTVGANVQVKEEGAGPDAPGSPIAMLHFIREIPGGIEFRTRFWMGYQIVDKKPVLLLQPGQSVPEAVPAGLFEHCISEYANLRVILPEIYREQGGMIP